MTKEPKKETPADEGDEDESVATSAGQPEEDDGSEEDTKEGVTVSEDFQNKAHQLLHKATKHEVNHIHDRARMREEELRAEEAAAEKKGKGKKGKDDVTFSTDSAPPGVDV